MRHREPCQVRKEAAISGSPHVPQTSLLPGARGVALRRSYFVKRFFMYTALYRSERPEIFGDVIGQEHIVRILRNQTASDTVGHAYLFCGTRGTGKTTLARLLAKAVNCTGEGERPCGMCANCMAIRNGTFMDMIEIDAASNNGVDNVRELRESVNYPPAVGKRKVYIIDEVHMLSTAAFNALLKTLEEPPEGVMFILATTDPQKLPQTILSRCLRLDFHRIPEGLIAAHMEKICRSRGVDISPDALHLLAVNADGSVRDGLSLLDQCLAGSTEKLDRDTVLEYLGTVSEDFFIQLTERIQVKDTAGALILLDDAVREGKDVRQLLSDWLSHCRSLLISKYVSDPKDMLNVSAENALRLRQQSDVIELADINNAIVTIAKALNDARYSTQPRILMELAVVTLAAGLGENMPGGQKQAAAQSAPVRRTAKSIREIASHKAKIVGDVPSEDKPSGSVPSEDAAEGGMQSFSEDNLSVEGGRQPKTRLSGSADDEAPDVIWERVWERMADDGGSSYLVRINTSLEGICDNEFRVKAANDVVRKIAEKNREALTNAMYAVTGRHIKMVLVSASEAEPEDEQTPAQEEAEARAERIADEFAEKFKIRPRIE